MTAMTNTKEANWKEVEDFAEKISKIDSEKQLLVEWCCSSSSKLTEVWLKTGRASLRLGLPEFDLNNEEVVRQVLEQVDRFLRQAGGSLCG